MMTPKILKTLPVRLSPTDIKTILKYYDDTCDSTFWVVTNSNEFPLNLRLVVDDSETDIELRINNDGSCAFFGHYVYAETQS